MLLTPLASGCGASCPKPRPPVTVVERCMTAPENVPPLSPFPPQNADGTYTLTEAYTAELVGFIYYLIDYVQIQYAKCGPVE